MSNANQLSLVNVIQVSVSAAQAGVGAYNTSNMALFTVEPHADSFGTDGYKIYVDPTDVATDFGTDSITFAQANAVFSQKPNILAGNGYLVIIPIATEEQTLTMSATPASGKFDLNFASGVTADIAWNDNAAAIQAKVRTLPGLSHATVTGSIAAGLVVKMLGYYGDAPLMTVTGDTLADSGSASVTVTVAQQQAGETLAGAITRTKGLVQYFGIISSRIYTQADLLAAAAVVQALNKIAAVVSRTSADVETGGMLDLLRSGGFTQTRGLYYGASTDIDALVMLASYMGRALSVNFSGSNTTSTMHLKDLIGVQPDPSMTQTLLTKCLAAGADTYISLQGVAKVFCSGANKFFDQIYNQQWFVGALQVAGFNYLAQSDTKVPQTEQGMDGLKNAYRAVCEQAVTNGYFAPGTWNSSTTFGSQSDFLANVSQRGYYIYALAIAKQLQADRAARKAPLCQIAGKEAGAIHESDVAVYVNA